MKEYPKNKGITLIIAIIIVSTLAVVGFSLSRLVAKEIGISSTIRESLKVIYVSDSGIECARYWATKNTKYFPGNGSPESEFREIKCSGQDFDLSSLYQGNSTYDFSLNINGSRADVSVSRERPDADSLVTNLKSIGYNKVSGDSKIQAFREYRVEGSFTDGGGAKDIMIAMDVSGSMGGSRDYKPLKECTGSSSREVFCAIHAARSFIEALLQPESDRRVGFVSFKGSLRCSEWFLFEGGEGRCNPNESRDSVDAYERLDVNMVGSEDIDIYLGEGGLLAYSANFHDHAYSNSYSNFYVPTLFSLAELNGQEILPRHEVCSVTDGKIDECPDNSFPIFSDLPANEFGATGRDRPDAEYPDAYILIGDFGANTYHEDDWNIKVKYNSKTPEIFLAEALKEMNNSGVEIYLIVIGGDSNSSAFKRMNEVGVEYHVYERDNYSELEDLFLNEVLSDLAGGDVIPVTEK